MRKYKYTEETISTNNDIKNEIYSSDEPCYTVLRAGKQNGGRGRLGRSFFSPAGGLYFSISLPISKDNDNIPVITLLSGLAASKAIDELCDVKTQIKWPNDIYLNGKKLGGILCELVSGKVLTAVIGIGINIGAKAEDIPEELKNKMTSVVTENGKQPSLDDLMRKITEHIDEMTADKDILHYIEEISKISYLTGQTVIYSVDGKEREGIFTDIAADGAAVIINNEGGRDEVRFGEVKMKS